MATIHLARLLGPQGFSRTVAVKQLHPQFAQNPQFVAMLLDEARLAVRVRHGNVLSPLDVVATGSELFIVMDYVNGESFANLLAASGAPLRPALAAAILVQVLLGLHAAHEATREQGEALGLVHRDVSPQNILVGQDGVARVLDFGIAKAVARTQTTDGGMVKGKLGYMAPEQLRLAAVDRRADLFSAGVVLWEALTGAGLFVADTLGASVELILHGEIAPPSQLNPAVTPELDAVVARALERDPDARFQDAMSMAAALQRATPLAGALEVIDWVEKLAGPELERKAELVRRAEALNGDNVDAMRPTLAATLVEAPPSGAPTTESDPAATSSKPFRRSATLKGLARPRDGHVVATAVMPTVESTGVAVGGDRDASAAAKERSSWEWKSLGVALGIVLCGSAVALGVFSLSGGKGESSLTVARQPSSVDPALAHPVSTPAPEVPGPAMPDPQAPVLPGIPQAPPVPSESTSSASVPSDPAQPAPRGSIAATPALPRAAVDRAAPELRSNRMLTGPASSAARPSGAAKASTASGRSAPASRASRAPTANTKANTKAPRSPSKGCNPPWIIDEQKVKRFKVECLR